MVELSSGDDDRNGGEDKSHSTSDLSDTSRMSCLLLVKFRVC